MREPDLTNVEPFTAEWARTIRSRRIARGWDQAELAEAVGATQQKISAWEHGKYAPTPYFQARLINAFGLDADDVYRLVRGAA